jgi:hypothetical protein
MRIGGNFIQKISEFGGSFDVIFQFLFSPLDAVGPSQMGYLYNIDFKCLFLKSLLLYVSVRVVFVLEVITILDYCPLLSSRGHP